MSTNTTDIATPVLIITRGLPGSGKSYLASALQESLGAERVVLLDPDTIDYKGAEYTELSKTLTEQGVEEKFHPNRFLKAKGYKAIAAHKAIIWTQAFTDLGGFHRSIASLQTYAAKHGIVMPVLVVEVEITHDVAKERAAKREAETGRSVPEEVFERFISDYRSFANEGFSSVTVHGEDDVAVSLDTVIKALSELRED